MSPAPAPAPRPPPPAIGQVATIIRMALVTSLVIYGTVGFVVGPRLGAQADPIVGWILLALGLGTSIAGVLLHRRIAERAERGLGGLGGAGGAGGADGADGASGAGGAGGEPMAPLPGRRNLLDHAPVLQRLIIAWALIEATGVMGLVLMLLGGPGIYLVVGSAILLLLHPPRGV